MFLRVHGDQDRHINLLSVKIHCECNVLGLLGGVEKRPKAKYLFYQPDQIDYKVVKLTEKHWVQTQLPD